MKKLKNLCSTIAIIPTRVQTYTTLCSFNILGVLSSGCSYGLENDTSMMMMMATPEEFDTNSITTNQDCHDLKISSGHHLSSGKRRSEPSILKLYAMKLGLNDRGCYISCALAALAFSLFVIVVTLAACWPGKLSDLCIHHSNMLILIIFGFKHGPNSKKRYSIWLHTRLQGN